MSYLNRDERREVILQAAMRVALEEGFTAMTVRRLAHWLAGCYWSTSTGDPYS